MRARHELDGDPRFAFPDEGRWALTWEDLLRFRHRGGLPGHAEMAGKTLFLKANTGPSGHGMPIAAGEALALKMAGCEEVKVFVVEGEGGLTPGATHETLNSAWGLGLANLVFLVDWNDYGIDDRPASSVVYGGPEDWFAPHGWRTLGTPDGMAWDPVARVVLEAARGENPDRVPTMAWFRTQKGRGYGKQDAKSHGLPHALNSSPFWAVRREFMARYDVTYEGVDEAAPDAADARRAQEAANLQVALRARGSDLARWLRPPPRDRRRGSRRDPGVHVEPGPLPDLRRHPDHRLPLAPAEMYRSPGEMAPTRAGLAWGSVNAYARPCTADLSSWPAPPTWPNPRTSPASARAGATRPAGAGTSATRTRGAPCCPRRSRRWRTPASSPAWPP
jgi:transketolase